MFPPCSAICDPVRDRLLVFGGYVDDVWALTLTETPTWSVLPVSGERPPARGGHTAIYDPVRDRMLVYGGEVIDAIGDERVWALSLTGNPSWSDITPAFSPPKRAFHTSIYDSRRDRMVIFGGRWEDYQATGTPWNNLADTWALSLGPSPADGYWYTLGPGIPPDPRMGHAAIYDPVRDRMVVWGGMAYLPGWQVPVNGPLPRNDMKSLAWSAPTAQDPARFTGVRGRDEGGLRLGRLWPNPSRGETVVELELDRPGRITVDAFDLGGSLVRRLADSQFAAGPHTLSWRGDDQLRHAVGPGVYFVRARSQGAAVTRRVVRVR